MIVIGGNNIREAARHQRANSRQQEQYLEDEVNNILMLFHEILKFAKAFPRCKIFIALLIRFPKTAAEQSGHSKMFTLNSVA